MSALFCLIILCPWLSGGDSLPAGSGPHGVEICDNGIDDDADGLIDLNDPDCDCPLVEPVSLIPNPSFEERDCCPSNRSQMDCASGWIQASTATTDYLHTCGWMGWEDMPVPLPLPDGEGCMGFRDGRPGGGFDMEQPQPNWKEYAGACLSSPLRAGVYYRFEFYIGFTYAQNSPPTTLAFFGATDCASLPFGEGRADFGCPTNGPGWIQLGSVLIQGVNEWKKKEISFVPPQDIYAIAIGPNCTLNPSSISYYYFFDNLVLAEQKEFDFQISGVNHACSEDFALSIPYHDTLQYQWYRNGIALVGETGPQLAAAGRPGNYQVRVLGPNSCRLAAVYQYRIPVITEKVEAIVCKGDTYPFGARPLSESGVYYDTLKSVDQCDSIVQLDLEVLGEISDTVSARIFEGESYRVGPRQYSRPGEYTAVLPSQYGCDSLVFLILDTYRIYIPNAFSPNGDGRNDTFGIFAGPGLQEVLRLRVFNRWGGLAFESAGQSTDGLPKSWDGTIDGQPAEPGNYVYQAIIVFDDGKERTVAGSVTLAR
ncbi:MAG: gliding motility-associated C-terminal domain-containing protein [Phaeodactylibacter sp.]|nr:gliding motility-associated C-terminal domain-containing protein [Phaeodactylibacter sp.]MCB9277220.1 gliding motility-associated C-terminal domain-containing protein [Lewinellaceae bacterium]